MNARQKAKKYKRMYEELVKRPIEVKVEQHKIERLKIKRYYPTALVMQENNEYFRHCIAKDIEHSLSENLGKYIDYYTEFCPHENKYCFVGEIKVIGKE